MSSRKIVHDRDFGIDDAMALLYMAAQPDVEVLAVGSVHGNTPTAAAAANARAVLDVAGLDDVPVALGAARPLAQPASTSGMVHGDDGLGGAAPAPSRPPADGVAAAEQLVRVVRAHPGEVTVVATGPLTNLALALLLDPTITDAVAAVVVMGGTLDAPGNITPWAEANIAHDPEAADLVLGAGWPLTLVGLDVTMATWMGPAELERIRTAATPKGDFVWSTLGHYLAFYASRHGQPGCPLHDPTAAAVALDPSVAGYLEVPVAVDLRSERTRGMLLVDRREFAGAEATSPSPAVRVATTIDSAAVVDRVVSALCGTL